jgi:hypothetical protein
MSEKTVSSSPNHPEFNAGAFTISHFSDQPGGFEFATKSSVGRTESLDADEHLELDDQEKRALAAAMRREMQFNDVTSVTRAREAWRAAVASGDTTEAERLQGEFDLARQAYIGRGKKIGLRAVELMGENTLTADVQLVPFPVYNLFADPESSSELQKLSSATGVAMVLKTSDDRLVIQHRAVEKQKIYEKGKTRGNASYVDIPGASVAGMVDAKLSSGNGRLPGTPDPIDTDFLKANILKEAGEELGLAPDDIKELRIVGLAQDHVKLHDEVLLLADSRLTAANLRETSRSSNRNKNLDDADFDEKFFDIESSPHAVEILLTDVKCPLPPTHAAALVAAGYSLVVQESGSEAAHAWRQRLELSVRENYEAMNAMTAAYYAQHPEALEQVPERYWGKRVPSRNRNGYSPAYTPEEQGLPSFEEEMIRTGLLPETRQHADRGYLFDVDGVITNPQEKRITNEAMFDEIISRLQSGEPVCFNTGRSTRWVMDRVVGPMATKMEDKSWLQNLVVVGEKGGTWTTFDADGTPYDDAVETISVPDSLKERVRELIAEKYSDAMFFDESKQTMLSVEMNDGYDIAAYTLRQAEFVRDVQALLIETSTDTVYRIDPTTIATDVESPYVSKALGADRFMEFLKYREFAVDSFEAFGDSGSDAAMADELARRNKSVEFIYVGSDLTSINPQAEYTVRYVGGYNTGTLQYLGAR